jgi:hypothetical protein
MLVQNALNPLLLRLVIRDILLLLAFLWQGFLGWRDEL